MKYSEITRKDEYNKLYRMKDQLETIAVSDVINDIDGVEGYGEIFYKGKRVVPDPIIPKEPPKLSPEEQEELDFKALMYGQGPDLDEELAAAKVQNELSKTALNMAKARELAVKNRIAARKSKRDG